jgi:hypothetical protein
LVCEHIDYLHVLHHKLKSRLLVNEVLTAYAVNEKQRRPTHSVRVSRKNLGKI